VHVAVNKTAMFLNLYLMLFKFLWKSKFRGWCA